MLSIAEITPLTSELGRQNPEYKARVGALLPNFPSDVLGSWFSEHPKAVAAFHTLGFEQFRFDRVDLTIAEAGGAAALRAGSTIAGLMADMPITHLGLRDYMLKHGTWPVPPILLNTAASVIPASVPHALRSPYHLMEGYHRFAMAADLAARNGETKHDFWLVTVE